MLEKIKCLASKNYLLVSIGRSFWSIQELHNRWQEQMNVWIKIASKNLKGFKHLKGYSNELISKTGCIIQRKPLWLISFQQYHHE